MPQSIKIILVSFLAGIIFAAGLVIASMNNPNYVQGFLNIGGLINQSRFGTWYPKLAFVMFGAVSVMFVVFKITNAKKSPHIKPLLSEKFNLPTKIIIDKKLVIGASLFGIGWGLYGYCPGPAIASLLVANSHLLLFIICMIVGMLFARKIS